MAITTYSELQTAVQNWMDRTDLSSRVPEGIVMAEAFFNRKLRARSMITTSTFTTTSGVATLPTDFLQVENLIWTGNPTNTLEAWDNAAFQVKYGQLNSGTPSAYMIQGSSVYVAPVDDTTSLKLVYYQRIPALTDSNTSNWLLSAHPDLYLFASLVEMEAFTLDAEAASLWKQRRDEVLNEVTVNDANWRGPSPAPKIVGMGGVTP